MKRLLISFLTLSMFLWTAAAYAATPARQMGLADCLRTAFEKHPDVRKIRSQIARAQADADSLRGAYFPQISVEGNVMVWDKELVASFGGLGGGGEFPTIGTPTAEALADMSMYDVWLAGELLGLTSYFEAMLGGLSGMGDMVLRDQVTWGFSARLTQPLTPLYSVLHGHKAKLLQRDQVRAHGETVKQDIGMTVAEAYYGALQAEAYVVMAQSGVDQLVAHIDQARAFLEQGIIGKNDVLKVEVQLADTQKQLVEAQGMRQIAQANLSAQMGEDPRDPVAPEAQPPGDTLPEFTLSLDEALASAIDRRTELRELAFGTEAAERGAKVAWWGLVPTLALVGQYEHVGGQGSLSEPDTFFAGLFLTWEIWDWGQKYYVAKSADAQLEELAYMKERTEQLLRLDVTDKYHRMRSAERAFHLARVTITQAEEALRIERERFEAQVATSTDVLDAEMALTRARANHINAYYSYLLARAQLRRAMGLSLLGH